jgi:hypothetical protein
MEQRDEDEFRIHGVRAEDVFQGSGELKITGALILLNRT